MTATSSENPLTPTVKGKTQPNLPPVSEIGVAALILIVIGGIYMSSYYPKRISLILPIILAVVAGAAMIYSIAMTLFSRTLAWRTFLKVLRWTLLVYFVVAGMLEYVFVYDGTRGSALIVLTTMLLIFALDVPMIIAFTVAKYSGEMPV